MSVDLSQSDLLMLHTLVKGINTTLDQTKDGYISLGGQLDIYSDGEPIGSLDFSEEKVKVVV